MNPASFFKERPQTVALLGLGSSRLAYGEELCQSALSRRWDHVWTVNFGMKLFRHDAVWVMDDLRRQGAAMPGYDLALRSHDRPIITATAYPEYPMAVPFPLAEVLPTLGDDFLNSTVAYSIAWAVHIAVKELWLYGCDFHYPNVDRREEGGQCAAYLLGYARARGVQVFLPSTTTLLGCYQAKEVNGRLHRPLYGYIKQPWEVSDDGSAGSEKSASVPAGSSDGNRTDHPADAVLGARA